MKEVEIMKIKLNPFEENIKSYDEYEIADWIFRCRNLITHDNTDIDDYIPKIKQHCDTWNSFREHNIKVFESDTFKKGMIMSAVARPKIIVKCGKEKIDITSSFYPETMGYMVNFPSNSVKDFVSTLKKCVVQSMDEYYEVVKNMFDNEPDDEPHDDEKIIKNYKKKIANAIKYLSAEDIFELKFDEISEKIKDTSSCSHSELIEELEKYKTYIPKKRQTAINKRLDEREISKSVYFDWLHGDTEEREFNKKFFVNLAFYLSLPSDYFEKLLMLNGYSTTGSLRIFDKIADASFTCGYSQTYAGILIADENEIREEKYIPNGGNLKDKNQYRMYDIYLVPELVKKYDYR